MAKTYGSYEAVQELHRGWLTTVFGARRTDAGPETRFAVKVFEPPPGSLTPEVLQQEIEFFLQAAKDQQALAAGGAAYLSPIHESAATAEGAYYATDLYERPADRLIVGHVKINTHALHTTISSVMKGLVQWQEANSRPHGNVKPTNVFLIEAQYGVLSHAVLADPLAAGKLKAGSGPHTDLHAVGELIHKLILHKPFTELGGWPVPESPHWAHLGKKADPWRELCNKLLDPDLAKQCPTLQELIEQELPGLAAPPAKSVSKVAVAAGVLAVAVAGGGYWLFGPEGGSANENGDVITLDTAKWEYLCNAYEDWVGPLYYAWSDQGRLGVWSSDPHLKKVLDQFKQIGDLNRIDPGQIIGRRGSRKALANPVPDEAHNEQAIPKVDEAYRLLEPVKLALEDWPILEAIRAKAKRYRDADWAQPAQYLENLLGSADLKWPERGEQKEDFVTVYNRILANRQAVEDLFVLAPGAKHTHGAFRQAFIQNAVAYLETNPGRSSEEVDEVFAAKLKQLGVLNQLVTHASGSIDGVQTEIDGILSQVNDQQMVEPFQQDLERYRNTLRSTLGLLEKQVEIDQIHDTVNGLQVRLDSLQQQASAFLDTPPGVADPRLAWRSRDGGLAAPQAQRIRQQIGTLERYADQGHAKRFDTQLAAIEQRIKALEKMPWTRRHRAEVDASYGGVVEAIDALEASAGERVAYLQRPLPPPDPRQELALLADSIRQDIQQLQPLNKSLSGQYEAHLQGISQELASSKDRPWIEAYKQQVLDDSSRIETSLDDLNQQVFAQLDPRKYWRWEDLSQMIASELRQTDDPQVKSFETPFDDLQREIAALTDGGVAWTVANRGQIQQTQQDLRLRLEHLADQVISDQRNLFKKKWDRLAQQVDAVMALRRELNDQGVSALQGQYQQLEDRKESIEALPWPDAPVQRKQLRADLNTLSDDLDRFFARLDPRDLWSPTAQRWQADIQDGLSQLAAKGEPLISQWRQEFESLLTEATKNQRLGWDEDSQPAVLAGIRHQQQSFEVTYRKIYSKLDPRLQYDWQGIVAGIEDQINDLHASDTTTARALLTRLSGAQETIAALNSQPWNPQEKEAIERDVSGLEAELRDIYITALDADQQLDGVASAAVTRAWRARRRELTDNPGDVARLQGAVEQLRRFLRERVDVLTAITPGEVHPRGWKPGIAQPLIVQKREDVLADAFKPWLEGSVNWQGATDDTRWESLVAGYRQWCDQVTAIGEDFRAIEDALVDAHALGHAPKGYRESIDQLYTQWQGRDTFNRFRGALGPVVGLIEDLRVIEQSADKAQLRDLADKGRSELSPAISFAAWRKLGQLTNAPWPQGVAELKKEYELRQWLEAMIRDSVQDTGQQQKLAEELRMQGPVRWTRGFLTLSKPQDVDEAVRLSPPFNVDPEKLPAWGRFNFRLSSFKQELSGFAHDTTDDQVRAAVTGFKQTMQSLPGGLGRSAAMESLYQEIDGLLAQERVGSDASVDLSQTGPEASALWDDQAWQKQATEDNARITYTWTKGGTAHTLEFVRIEASASVPKSFYLCTTEVSFGLFKDIVSALDLEAQFASLLDDNNKWEGPKVWRTTRSGRFRTNTHRNNPIWTPPDTQLVSDGGRWSDYFNDQPPDGPTEQHPMQYLTADSAVWLARLTGCRVPTSAEWVAAFESEAGGRDTARFIEAQHPNLRDQRWQQQMVYAAMLQNERNVRIDTPDRGRFGLMSNQGETPGTAGEPWSYDDGLIWFDRAVAGTTASRRVFHHLVGNVAEYVFDQPEALEAIDAVGLGPREAVGAIRAALQAGGVGVIGGSAQSPTNVPVDQPQLIQPDADKQAFSDVGVRLAFSAPRQSLKAQIQLLLDQQAYLTAQGPSR